MIKILLDCSRQKTGGGIQNGLAVLNNANQTPDYEWYIFISKPLADQLGANLKHNFRHLEILKHERSPLDIKSNMRRISQFDKILSPDIACTLFGTPYWKASCPHLVGFAQPQYLYSFVKPFKARTSIKSSLSNLIESISLSIQRHYYRKADYLYCETDTVRQKSAKALGFPLQQIFVIRNTYSPIFAESSKTISSSASGDVYRILVPSAYYAHKNLEFIPYVAAQLKMRLSKPYVFVLTIPRDGVEWKHIFQIAKQQDVEKNVSTVGRVDHRDLSTFYSTGHAVFLPTLMECSTAVYPESFFSNIPVVTSNRDFAREQCGDAALYFDPFVPKDAALQLVKILENKQLRIDLIKKGKEMLCLNYPTPDEKWHNLLALFNKITESEHR